MKTSSKKRALTFGDLISSVYQISGKRRAKAIVIQAVNAHWLQFRGKQTFLIS